MALHGLGVLWDGMWVFGDLGHCAPNQFSTCMGKVAHIWISPPLGQQNQQRWWLLCLVCIKLCKVISELRFKSFVGRH